MTSSFSTDRRRAGVLLHPTSLPGPWEAGTLGADAGRFAGFLAEAGFGLWQMLPIGPVGDSLSPYQSTSAFAGNPRLVDPEALRAQGWLDRQEAPGGGNWPDRARLLREAWAGFEAHATAGQRAAFAACWQAERSWLLPYALFCAARERFGDGGWWTWPKDIRQRRPAAIAGLLAEERSRILEIAFVQWTFASQWEQLRDSARGRGVELIGDLPIYVDLDSADVWWHRHLFRVDEEGRPDGVAGVPPDYFSADGQLWGNPLYAWDVMRADGFRWWIDRVRTQLRRFDYLRIDHFRGLESYWEVPAGARSARDGCWRAAPGSELLTALGAAFGGQPFLAEDLGTITPEVHALRRRFGLPGMLIAQFAFDGSPANPYLPAHHEAAAVIYPGTHDNDTVVGWYKSLPEATRAYVHQVLGCGPAEMPDALLRMVWESRAFSAIFPLQDLLGLGSEARMNTPNTPTGNWRWRFDWGQVPEGLAAQCRREVSRTGRLAASPVIA